MSDIHVARDRSRLGTFSEEEIAAGLRSGRFFPSDLAWREGMENWLVLSQWPEFSEARAGMAGQAPEPGESGPAPEDGFNLVAPPPVPEDRPGLPWENREGRDIIPAIVDTIKLVLMKPQEAFSIMNRQGGLAAPLIYGLLLASVGGWMFMFYQTIFEAVTGMGESKGMLRVIASLVGGFFTVPIGVACGLFISAGLTHLCLMLIGGAKQPFETTFRTICYANGSTAVLQVVPFCGIIATAIWNIVAVIIGLSKTQEIPPGKAAVAVFLPAIACCALLVAVLGALGAAGFLTGLAGAHGH